VADVRAWIDRLGLSIAEAARHVGLESDQLERILEFPDKNLSVRALLEILEGLGLGLVGVEALTPVALLRYLDQIREVKGMTKKDLALKAEVNRPWLIALFQEKKPEPKLETILKLARVLEVDLVIEKRRELPPLEPLAAQAQPASPASSPTTTPAAAASTTTSPPSPDRPADLTFAARTGRLRRSSRHRRRLSPGKPSRPRRRHAQRPHHRGQQLRIARQPRPPHPRRLRPRPPRGLVHPTLRRQRPRTARGRHPPHRAGSGRTAQQRDLRARPRRRHPPHRRGPRPRTARPRPPHLRRPRTARLAAQAATPDGLGLTPAGNSGYGPPGGLVHRAPSK
jgi:DNA-binding phage protein